MAGQTPLETGSEEAGEGGLESEVRLLVPRLCSAIVDCSIIEHSREGTSGFIYKPNTAFSPSGLL